MTLSSGTRLGVYEVIAPLGAGGMGEVWRARDTRLSREVAIKVLPADFASDPSRLKRFEKEARSASALNHPNIVTIYEIGSSDSISYIAMERVEGKTLRELLFGGALPVKKLLPIAAQIADGLAKAHEAGIVHRDLKPENVMVTKDGLVKILDFGLAKLTQIGSGSEEGSHLPTETGTSAGVVLGTAGYMSPEQAAGQPVDFRSDQFSFGSILYEMATGKRAFQKGTSVDTLSAILHEDPEPVSEINPQAPAPLRWIVVRCLAKDPDGRYASTKDLARELANLRDHISEASLSSEPIAILRPTRRPWLLGAGAGALLAAALLGLFAGKVVWRTPSSSPSFQRLTFRRGSLSNARFAPDGRTIVYAAEWEGESDNVYLTQIGSTESRQLLENADLYDVSSSGELALRIPGTGPQGMLSRMPLTGGAPRSVAADIWWGAAAWAPDGKDLAIVRTVQGRNRLEYPIGRVLYETTNRIGSPRFSPGGNKIAFYESDRGSSIVVLDVSSKVKRVLSTGWTPLRGGMPTWTPDGKEVWFAGAARGHAEA